MLLKLVKVIFEGYLSYLSILGSLFFRFILLLLRMFLLNDYLSDFFLSFFLSIFYELKFFYGYFNYSFLFFNF